MTKGFIKGMIWGGAVSVVSICVLSVVAEGPMPPSVVTQGPQAGAVPQGKLLATDRSSGDRVPVTGQKAPKADSPSPDTLAGLGSFTTVPAAVPEVGAATQLSATGSVDGSVGVGDLPIARPAEPKVGQGATQALPTPSTDIAVTVAAEPLAVPQPAVRTHVTAGSEPGPRSAETGAPTAASKAPVAPDLTTTPSEPSISSDPAQPPQPSVPVQSTPFDPVVPETPASQTAETAPATDPEAATPTEAVSTGTDDIQLSDAPVIALVEAPAAPVAGIEISPANDAVPLPDTSGKPAAAAIPPPPQKLAPTSPEKDKVLDIAQTRPAAVADTAPTQASRQPETETDRAVETPPARVVTGASDVPGKPAGTLGDLAAQVRTNRLPTLADPAEDAEPPAELPAVAEILDRSGAPPVERFAAPVDNPEGKPMMSVVLLDQGADLSAQQIGLPALRSFPFPVSFAVDVTLPDARDRMQAYRAEGFEVWALVDLPEAASARDAEATVEVVFAAMPEAVGLFEGVGKGVQVTREAADQVTAILAQTGHGFVAQNRGLNTVQKLAAKSGVPSAVVFRDFDSAGQSPTVIRRFLDQAAFRAGQEGGVVMLGRLREETISALLLWALQSRVSQVAMVPVSGLLKAEE